MLSYRRAGFSASLDGHGDANGDGLSDILIDSRLWYGGTWPEHQTI